MRAFVTGATGFLGGNLVQALLDQGHEVRGLVRSKEKAAKAFPSAKVDFVSGDMSNVAGFAPSLAGCDVLFHTAAYFREYFQPGDHKATIQKINVQGTVDLLIAAEKQRVAKAIHISSAGVVGRKPDGSAGDENSLPDDHATSNLYFASKIDTIIATEAEVFDGAVVGNVGAGLENCACFDVQGDVAQQLESACQVGSGMEEDDAASSPACGADCSLNCLGIEGASVTCGSEAAHVEAMLLVVRGWLLGCESERVQAERESKRNKNPGGLANGCHVTVSPISQYTSAGLPSSRLPGSFAGYRWFFADSSRRTGGV